MPVATWSMQWYKLGKAPSLLETSPTREPLFRILFYVSSPEWWSFISVLFLKPTFFYK